VKKLPLDYRLVKFMFIFLTSFLCVYSNNLFAKESNSDEKLVFATTLTRHGDRTPWQPMLNKKYQYDWKLGIGALTPRGMREEYDLGKYLRNHYINETHLLPEKYENGTIHVWSGPMERLFDSAQSLMYGLYPLGIGPVLPNGDPAIPASPTIVPIYTLQGHEMFDPASNSKKDLYLKLLKKYIYTTPLWKEKEKELHEKYPLEKWSKIAGYPITNYFNIQGFVDNLNVRYIHHVPFPEGISIETYKEIYPSVDWSEAYVFSAPETGYLEGGTIITSMAKYIRDYKNGKDGKLKFAYYSGHDVTICGVMSALGVPLNIDPHYASYLSFELYENSTGNHTVKIVYNHKEVKLPYCQNQTCTYEQFIKLADEITEKQKILFSENN
jgi:acid phosphatase